MRPVQVGAVSEAVGEKGEGIVRGCAPGLWEGITHARPKSLSLMCPSGSNKKFCGGGERY